MLAPILSWPLDQGPSFKQQASSQRLTGPQIWDIMGRMQAQSAAQCERSGSGINTMIKPGLQVGPGIPSSLIFIFFGLKSQASSSKRQAASNKLTDHGPFIKFQAPRTKALGKYKRIVRMPHMPCHLVWTQPQLVTLRDLKLYCKKSIIFVVTQSIWHTWNA